MIRTSAARLAAERGWSAEPSIAAVLDRSATASAIDGGNPSSRSAGSIRSRDSICLFLADISPAILSRFYCIKSKKSMSFGRSLGRSRRGNPSGLAVCMVTPASSARALISCFWPNLENRYFAWFFVEKRASNNKAWPIPWPILKRTSFRASGFLFGDRRLHALRR
jgi:hypothetical protein